MHSWIIAALLLIPQQQPPQVPPPSEPKEQQRSLKDEEAGAEVKEYYVDPVQAQKEIETGNFYMKKGSYTAAAKRFEEATKWQPSNALAYGRLGLALEKKDDPLRAAQAYKKALTLNPNGKDAKELRKKIEKLEKEAEK